MLCYEFCFLSHGHVFSALLIQQAAFVARGLFLLKYDAGGGLFRKLWRAAVNREPYYESVRLKQLKPEVLSNSFFTSSEWK